MADNGDDNDRGLLDIQLFISFSMLSIIGFVVQNYPSSCCKYKMFFNTTSSETPLLDEVYLQLFESGIFPSLLAPDLQNGATSSVAFVDAQQAVSSSAGQDELRPGQYLENSSNGDIMAPWPADAVDWTAVDAVVDIVASDPAVLQHGLDILAEIEERLIDDSLGHGAPAEGQSNATPVSGPLTPSDASDSFSSSGESSLDTLGVRSPIYMHEPQEVLGEWVVALSHIPPAHPNASVAHLLYEMSACHGVTQDIGPAARPNVTTTARRMAAEARRTNCRVIYYCPYFPDCQSTHTRRHGLRDHMQLHEDQRSFACPDQDCQFSTNTAKGLKSHTKHMHKQKGDQA